MVQFAPEVAGSESSICQVGIPMLVCVQKFPEVFLTITGASTCCCASRGSSCCSVLEGESPSEVVEVLILPPIIHSLRGAFQPSAASGVLSLGALCFMLVSAGLSFRQDPVPTNGPLKTGEEA